MQRLKGEEKRSTKNMLISMKSSQETRQTY